MASMREKDGAENGKQRGQVEEVGKAKRDFHHPFTPYPIQETFMETVYEILEAGDGRVGILESPTGTGKSLSLICASMTWLRDHKMRKFEEGLEWVNDSDEPEWIVEQAKVRKRREMLHQREEMETRLANVRAKEKAQREKYRKGEQSSKRRKTDNVKDDGDEDQFLLDDYESDREGKSASTGNATNGLSAETLALMEKIGMSTGRKKEEEEVDDEIKIFFCSRTHSQLSQFVNELRRVKIPPALPPDEPSKTSPSVEVEEFKHLALGSRKNLCINPSVSKLRSVTAINERCLELQQPNTPAEKKCCYLPNKDNQPLVNSFRDHSLASIRDIEELGSLGREIGICPYYASRAVIKPSEVVTLPYPLLLQKSAREALGINLKGHVVIIDEAHNLMDAISGIHGISVTLAQLKRSRSQLGVYLQKFRNKLMGKNRVYVAQVVRILDSLSGYLEGKVGPKQSEGTVEPAELLKGKGVDQINLYKLLRYLQESKLARKVEGYIIHTEHQATTAPTKLPSNPDTDLTAPTLQHISSLIAELSNPSAEGQLFYSHQPSSASNPSITTLKYLLLDPTHSFQSTIATARAVILAGGTMSPMSDYTTHLLSFLPQSHITTLSCAHIIPSQHLLTQTLSRGPNHTILEFSFSKRSGPEGLRMLDDLGLSLLQISTVVPDGMIIFFPSYAFLADAISRWESPTSSGKSPLLSRLRARKPVFWEARSSDAPGRDVLVEYSNAIHMDRGGILFGVINGRLSEGINFSDKLGRCVVVVGLPFPNPFTAEFRAREKYIQDRVLRLISSTSSLNSTSTSTSQSQALAIKASKTFFENSIMRSVNQCVGRAIRHRNDYAAIVLIDVRFGSEERKAKLSGWIRAGMGPGEEGLDCGALVAGLEGFFRGR